MTTDHRPQTTDHRPQTTTANAITHEGKPGTKNLLVICNPLSNSASSDYCKSMNNLQSLGFNITTTKMKTDDLDQDALQQKLNKSKAQAVLIFSSAWHDSSQDQKTQEARIVDLLTKNHPTMPYAIAHAMDVSNLGGKELNHGGAYKSDLANADANRRIATYLDARIKGADHSTAFAQAEALGVVKYASI